MPTPASPVVYNDSAALVGAGVGALALYLLAERDRGRGRGGEPGVMALGGAAIGWLIARGLTATPNPAVSSAPPAAPAAAPAAVSGIARMRRTLRAVR